MSLRRLISSPARPRWAIAFVAVATVGAAILPAPSAPAQTSRSGPRIELISQPVYYGAQDDLGLRIRISNPTERPLRGLRVNVNLLPRLTSRFALRDTFDGASGFGAQQNDRIPGTVPAGDRRMATINLPVRDLIGSLTDTAAGVYPLSISLLDADFAALSSFTTHALYYPDRPGTRLNLALVLPLNDLPARAGDGRFDFSTAGGGTPLPSALRGGGWLGSALQTLRRFGGSILRVGVAPTPRLIEEIADLSNGYRTVEGERVSAESSEAASARAFIDGLGGLLGRPGIQPLLTPYSWPDLPALARDLPSHIETQVSEGQQVLADTLGVDPGRTWLLPPAGRIDLETVERFSAGTGERMFVSDATLADGTGEFSDEPCSDPELTLTCPVSLDTPRGSITGFVPDVGLQERLNEIARRGEDRLDLQHFFAETAMIREELPGRADRIVAAVAPPIWQPSGILVRSFLRGLATSPWLRTVTPDEGLGIGIGATSRQLVDRAEEGPVSLDEEAFEEIAAAAAAVTDFSEVRPPDQLVERLSRNVLVAEDRTWWSEPVIGPALGLAYAGDTLAEIDRIFGKIDIEVSRGITLTSRSEDIPLRVVNDTGYPIRLSLRLDSPKLVPERPEIVQVFEGQVTPLTVSVTSRTSGISILDMELATPGCASEECIITTQRPTIRSTDFNNIALTITVGALLFLISFFLLRWIKRRNQSSSEQTRPSP